MTQELEAKHQAAGGTRPGSNGPYQATVNRRLIDFAHPEPDGRDVLQAAGDHPADDYDLIALEAHGTRSIGLDERVDLRKPGTHAFRTFKSDRIFRFTINEHGYEWGVAVISEPELREIGRVPEDEVLVLKRDGKDEVLRTEDKLDLAKPGTEHLVTKKRLVKVFYDTEPKEIPAGVYTTEQLIKIFDVPAGYLLNVVDEHGQLVTLKPGQPVRVHEDQKFFSQVPSGSSS
jgi:hypothetical protein